MGEGVCTFWPPGTIIVKGPRPRDHRPRLGKASCAQELACQGRLQATSHQNCLGSHCSQTNCTNKVTRPHRTETKHSELTRRCTLSCRGPMPMLNKLSEHTGLAQTAKLNKATPLSCRGSHAYANKTVTDKNMTGDLTVHNKTNRRG